MPKSISASRHMSYMTALYRLAWPSVLLVGAFVLTMFPAQAQMQPYRTAHPHAQTISHCGLLKTRPVIYAAATRKKAVNTRIVQKHLQELGYSLGRSGVDGIFGRYTKRAVMKFQSDSALARDGIVGPHTARTLSYKAHPVANVRRCKAPARMRSDAF